MRFPELPIGARFEYQGKTYSKTSALLASAEDGSGQRIIPKYADLKPADGGTAEIQTQRRLARVDMAALAAAIAAYDATCRELLRQGCQDPVQVDAVETGLDNALARLRQTLDGAASP